MFLYDDLIGKPFIEKGRGLDGVDCWGLIMVCLQRMGIDIVDPFVIDYQDAAPREGWQRWIIERFPSWKRMDEPKSGAVAIFATRGKQPNHAGVMIDNIRFIHAVRRAGVVIGRLDRCPHKLLGIYEYTG